VRKLFAILGSAAFFVIAPMMVAGFVPWWIARRGQDVSTLAWPLRGLGVTLAAVGAAPQSPGTCGSA